VGGWIDPDLDEVEAGGAGEDAPRGGGGDVGGLGAAAGREEGTRGGGLGPAPSPSPSPPHPHLLPPRRTRPPSRPWTTTGATSWRARSDPTPGRTPDLRATGQ
jgi:hypothetical protein